MNEYEYQEKTQAQKWINEIKDQTVHITGVSPLEMVAKIVATIDAAYPNQLFVLTKKGRKVGARRVFRDRSYLDAFDESGVIGKIIFGMMSDGVLGTAQNGRIIVNAM